MGYVYPEPKPVKPVHVAPPKPRDESGQAGGLFLLTLLILALLALAYAGNTRPDARRAAEIAASAWVGAHPNYDTAICR